MNKQRGSRHSLLCIDIQNAYKTKGTNFLHLVTFKDANGNYIAEENESLPVSKFQKGVINTFEVTHPGSNGKPDWIRCQSESGEISRGPVTETLPSRPGYQYPEIPVTGNNDSSIAQTAFQAAVQYGLKLDWTTEEVIEKAYIFAGNIKRIAKRIGADPTI